MTLLPIVEWELRVAARRRGTFWIRTAFALGTIAIGFFVWLDNRFSPPNVFGQELFGAFADLSVFYCLTCGLRSTADCLSEEKREGTLGLLFLTDLRGRDIILGKLAATSFAGIYALLATFPILAIPLVMGGVAVETFWRILLLLVNTTVLSLAVGIFVSAVSRSSRKAIVGTLGLLLLLGAGLPIVAGLLYDLMPSHKSALGDSLLLTCPFFCANRALQDGSNRTASHDFWWSFGVMHGLVWLFLGLACFIVPRSWQDRPRTTRSQRWREFWQSLAYGTETRRKSIRTRMLDRNPVFWLGARTRLKAALVWGTLASVMALWVLGYLLAGQEWLCEGTYLPLAILLNSALKLWFAFEAGRNLADDRNSGALELVLSTPLSVGAMLRGQWMALRGQFLGPILAVIGLHLILLAASLQRESFHAQPINPVLWVSFILLLAADVIALGWVGLWGGLNARKPSQLIGMTFIRILAAPWILFLLISILASAFIDDNPSEPVLNWKFHVGLWFGLGLLLDLAFGLQAALHLHTSFRALALQRYSPVPSPLARWFRRPKLSD